ncbi:MAG: hypothetical protein SNJ56_03730 [Termitinemataceae bacterium]
MHPAIKILLPLIIILGCIAALGGMWPAEGTPYSLITFRGEQVTINARGLYYWDTVSSAAQMQANDLVVLVLAIPLLIISFLLALRGSLRGRMILAGTLGFILYTYITMVFGAHFNSFFLVYVALFSLSLFSLILVMISFDVSTIQNHFSSAFIKVRQWIVGFLFFAAAFLSFAWLARIAVTFKPESIPALDNTTSMFIQAMDLAIIVPFCVITGLLLLRKNSWGYLLAPIGLIKFVTLGLAVSLMGFNMARLGVPISIVELTLFPAMTVAGLLLTILLLRNIKE